MLGWLKSLRRGAQLELELLHEKYARADERQNMQRRIDNLSSDLRRANQDHAETRELLQEQYCRIDSLKSYVAKCQETIKECASEARDTATVLLAKNADHVMALESEVARLQENCHALANDHTLMVKAMRDKDAEIETLSKAVDSWKACNTAARQERDEAREAARTFYFGSKWQTQGTAAISRYPWLEEE